MIKFHSGRCPVCRSKLNVGRLVCGECKAEYPVGEPLSPFDYLSEEQISFLLTFLKREGNIKETEKELGISYPTVKRRLGELLVALGVKSETEKTKNQEEVDISMFGFMNRHGNKASDVVRAKLYDCKGIATVTLQRGEVCGIRAENNGMAFSSDKLPGQIIDLSVFDIIVDFLKENGGKAPKGMARGKDCKVGYGKCTPDTVAWTVATKYYQKGDGESSFDPIFVLAAVLEWAGIAKNGYGYIQLY